MYRSKSTVSDFCFIGIMAAVTAVMAQISIPMPMGVPMTMQTFAVTLAGIILGSRRGALSMLVYLLIGVVGVPVFSNFTGGLPSLVGPTGGFLVSFPIMAYLIGLGIEFKNRLLFVLLLILGTLSNYVIGVLFYTVITGSSPNLQRIQHRKSRWSGSKSVPPAFYSSIKNLVNRALRLLTRH